MHQSWRRQIILYKNAGEGLTAGRITCWLRQKRPLRLPVVSMTQTAVRLALQWTEPASPPDVRMGFADPGRREWLAGLRLASPAKLGHSPTKTERSLPAGRQTFCTSGGGEAAERERPGA